MELKEAFTLEQVSTIIENDPVRGHIAPELRLNNGARVFYYEPIENCKAAVCLHTSRIIPDNEEQLITEYNTGGASKGGTKAIFYTVWSNQKGLGRAILNATLVQLIIENNHDRYITLSPKTELAKAFHLNNGAKLIQETLWANNFEYRIHHGHHRKGEMAKAKKAKAKSDLDILDIPTETSPSKKQKWTEKQTYEEWCESNNITRRGSLSAQDGYKLYLKTNTENGTWE